MIHFLRKELLTSKELGHSDLLDG